MPIVVLMSHTEVQPHAYWLICCGGNGSFDVQKAMSIFSEPHTRPDDDWAEAAIELGNSDKGICHQTVSARLCQLSCRRSLAGMCASYLDSALINVFISSCNNPYKKYQRASLVPSVFAVLGVWAKDATSAN